MMDRGAKIGGQWTGMEDGACHDAKQGLWGWKMDLGRNGRR